MMIQINQEELVISIHALTRSATTRIISDDILFNISIHALTRSATLANRGVVMSETISIHALTKSATASVGATERLAL